MSNYRDMAPQWWASLVVVLLVCSILWTRFLFGRRR